MSLNDEDIVDIDVPDQFDEREPDVGRWLYENFLRIRVLLTGGATGSFTTTDSKTVTVTRGVITDITP